jgi:hypothetical protein
LLISLLPQLERQGITREELEDLVTSVKVMDAERRQLHIALNALGGHIDLSEDDVLADISGLYGR